jgi:hypothetical protein
MESRNNQQNGGRQLPSDVHNAAQDPNSMRDPLKEQLERSEGQNGAEEQKTLEQLRRREEEHGHGNQK